MRKTTCSVDGCAEPGYARGLCHGHYNRAYHAGTLPPRVARPTAAERYEALIDRSGGPDACHPLGKADGHRKFYISPGNYDWAHRFGWELAFGPIPDSLHVLHRCDNPPCQNPRHWFLGDQAANNRDRDKKGRGVYPQGERHGKAKLTDADVREMRRLHDQGVGDIELARRFGVAPGAAWGVTRRKTWRHVD